MAAARRADEALSVAALQRQCAREIKSLRDQLCDREYENELLRRKLEGLTARLSETTQELEHRSALYSEATERAEQQEAQVADAKKALLTREMRIHELTQQIKALEAVRSKDEQAKEYWEREYVTARDQVNSAARAAGQLKEKARDRAVEITGWKNKLQLALTSIHDLKEELEARRHRETQLADGVQSLKMEQSETERRWKSKLEKRDKAILALQSQLQQLNEARESVDDRARELSEKETLWRSNEAMQQLERRRQLLALEDELQTASGQLEKAKMKEMLSQRELCRLREEVLLSESQRKTERRRHEQQLKGKEKEMAFIWQKYVEVKASTGDLFPRVVR